MCSKERTRFGSYLKMQMRLCLRPVEVTSSFFRYNKGVFPELFLYMPEDIKKRVLNAYRRNEEMYYKRGQKTDQGKGKKSSELEVLMDQTEAYKLPDTQENRKWMGIWGGVYALFVWILSMSLVRYVQAAAGSWRLLLPMALYGSVLLLILWDGWLRISFFLQEIRVTKEGLLVKKPLRKPVCIKWAEFQQVCLCRGMLDNKMIFRLLKQQAQDVILCLKPGEKADYTGKWKLAYAYRSRNMICMVRSEALLAAFRANCPLELQEEQKA